MVEKLKEFWNNSSLYVKVLSIAAPILLLVDTLVVILLIFDVPLTDTLRGVGKLSMALLWGLVGPVWWKNHKLLSVCFFGVSLVNILHAALLFLG